MLPQDCRPFFSVDARISAVENDLVAAPVAGLREFFGVNFPAILCVVGSLAKTFPEQRLASATTDCTSVSGEDSSVARETRPRKYCTRYP